MKIGILGSGAVGQELAKAFASEGHKVWIATRDLTNGKAENLRQELKGVTVCEFATAASEAELAVFCVNWGGARDAVKLVGPKNLAGKVIVDATNPLVPAMNGVGIAPDLPASAGELVQEWFRNGYVVKAFNSVGSEMMYKPKLPQQPTMFIASNHQAAKDTVSEVVRVFGWEVFDAGDIAASRELEALAVLWINHVVRIKDHKHAFKFL